MSSSRRLTVKTILSHADFMILLSLAEQDRHGYGIMQEVKEISDGMVKLGPGTLYGAIKRLLEMKFISESGSRPKESEDDERRRCYYRLTGAGRKAAQAEAERLATVVGAARERKLLHQDAITAGGGAQ